MDNSLISYCCILAYLKKKTALKKPREKNGLFEKTSGFLPTLREIEAVVGENKKKRYLKAMHKFMH